MAKHILLALLCLILGASIGSAFTRYVAQRHQHARAVMWLQQFHLDRLRAATQAKQCQVIVQERLSLGHLFGELLQAFPLAYAQDAEFRTRADALRTAVQATGTVATECVNAGAAGLRQVRDACDACHREYRN